MHDLLVMPVMAKSGITGRLILTALRKGFISMKQKTVFVGLALFSLFGYSCDHDSSQDPGGCGGGIDISADQQTFWAYNFTNRTYYQLTAAKRATSDRAVVYVANDQLGKISEAQAQSIADEYSNNIYSSLTPALGPQADVDCNGLIIILCLEILDGGAGFIVGYFDDKQEFVTEDFSNAADIIYMDSKDVSPASDVFNNTLAHEFTHMIQFNQQQLIEGGNPTVTWINEGIAEIGRHLAYGQVVEDTSHYSSDPNSLIKNGLSLTNWQNSAANYAQGYVYMSYVMSQASNGSSFFKEFLEHSDNAEDGFEATLNSYVNGWDLETTYRNWLIATFLRNPSGIYSYNGVISFSGPPYADSSTTHSNIKPFAALFLKYDPGNDSVSVTSTANMAYIGVNQDGDVDSSNLYNTTGNGALILYNLDSSWRKSGIFNSQAPGSWSPVSNRMISSAISAKILESTPAKRCGTGILRQEKKR